MSRIRPLLLAAAGLAAVSLSPAAAEAKTTTILISGSTSVNPLANSLAHAFVKKYPGTVKFSISQGGSDIGITDVSVKRVSIGASSRDTQSGDPGGLVFSKIARDGVCVVTNPANPIADFSQQQVQDIFSGKIRRWDDVPGAKVKGPINLAVRTQASGTQDAFRNIFMGQNLNVAPSASQKATNGLVQAEVRSNRQAIGYVDFKFTGGTHAASYKGVACNLRNAKSGQYPGVRNFWFVTLGKPTGAVKKFIDFARSASVQSTIVAKDYVQYK